MGKSLLVAYGLWALGGPLGLHHLYLGRDTHALLWMLTLGGFGGGWLWDFWHLPGWVAAANGTEAPTRRGGPVPAFSPLRLAGQVAAGMYFGLVAALGPPWVPEVLAQPLAVGLGVLLVSWVGEQRTEVPGTLAAAFIASLLLRGRLLALPPVSLAASIAAQRRRRYKPRGTAGPGLPTRLCRLGLACLAFATPLACRGLYGAVGVVGTLLSLPRAALEVLLLPLRALRILAQLLGMAGANPAREAGASSQQGSGSKRQQWAYEVLGLPSGSSAEDVHRSYRELVKLWHPDHNRHRAEEAQRRFIELQEAYEELAGPRRAAGG
ncbi:DJC22 protein, partial [Psilopogon haemacephalus]|nr:DJC22 protein [Psilopogon haemacephalus]